MILSPLIPNPLQLLRVRNYPSVPLRDKHDLPYRTSAVYYAVRGYKILYIGKSSNIYYRWNSSRYGEHHRMEELIEIDEMIGDVDIHYCKWPEPLIGFVEAIEIRRFRPKMNRRTESIWENINLPVIVFVLKYFCTQFLMAALTIAVIGLLTYHFVF